MIAYAAPLIALVVITKSFLGHDIGASEGFQGMIVKSLRGPIIACLLFLMPMYAIRRVPSLRQYSGQLSNVFVGVIGLIALSAIVFSVLP